MTIDQLFIGKIQSLAGTSHKSAIHKTPITGPTTLTFKGLSGDSQADKIHHGGVDKSLHHYSADHFAFWIRLLGETYREKFVPGGFGENISCSHLNETNVCLGDRYQVGTAIVEVSQARQPCWKLNLRFGHPQISKLTQDYKKTGWYYRVLQEGQVTTGDSIILLERPLPDWPLDRLLHVLYHEPLNFSLLEEMTLLEPLAQSWKQTIMTRLETSQVENWDKRLYNNYSSEQ